MTRSRGVIHAAPVLVLSAVLAGLGAWLITVGDPGLAGPALLTSVLPLPLLLAGGRRVVVSGEGVWAGGRVRGRTIPWSRVSGLGAAEVGGSTRYVVYVADGPDVVFGADWTGAEAVAASIQARAPRPRGKADLAAALADPPRGDLRASLGAPPEVLDRLLDLIEQVLAARGVRRMDRRRLQAFGDPQVYELFAICRRMIREPEAHWEAHLRAHFRRVDGLRSAATELAAKPPKYDEVQGKLRLQLTRGPRGRPIGAGFGLVLVLREPQGEISVGDEVVARWGVPRDQVVSQAEDNLLATRLQAQRDPLGISTWLGEYAAAQIAILDRRMDLDPDLGALVAAPSQDVLVAVPILDRVALDHLLQGGLGPMVPQVYEHTAAPLSPQLYWWCRGKLSALEPARGGAGHLAPQELHKRLTLREAGLGARRA